MREKIDLWRKLHTIKYLKQYLSKAKTKYPKWCQGARYYDVLENFINGMQYGFLDSRASAIAFQFFIALFPFLLAVACIIPYMPFDKEYVIFTISGVLPANASSYLMDTIRNFFTVGPSLGFTSLSMILLIIFSSKGISTMMKSLNNSYQPVLDRPWWVMRIISLIFALGIFIMIVIILSLTFINNNQIFHWLRNTNINKNAVIIFFNIFKILFIILFTFFIIAFIFYYSPGGKKKVFNLMSPGALVSVTIISFATILFSIYLNNFNNYNYFYGSLGAMIIFMVLLKIYAIALIIGFELNAAIGLAKNQITKADQQNIVMQYKDKKILPK